MDDAVAGGVEVALATAAAAARFGGPSERARRSGTARRPATVHAVPDAVARGARRRCRSQSDGRVVGGLGVGGVDPVGLRRARPGGALRMSDVVRVAVLGCGAIGSLYAAHLARVAGVEVWAVDPWREHVAAIEARRAAGHRRRRLRRPGARPYRRGRTCRACELRHRRDQGAAHPRRRRGGPVARWPTPRWSACRTGSATRRSIAEVAAAGDARQHRHRRRRHRAGDRALRRAGRLLVRAVRAEPGPARRDRAAGPAADRGRPATHAVADARGPQWTKVVFNAATSPLAALTGLTVGQVCTDPALRREVDRLIAEALAVCAAAGIDADPRPGRLGGRRRSGRPSGTSRRMLQDVLARRPTEIDVLNGGIADEGRRVGVATPGHDAMVALVHGLERSWSGRSTASETGTARCRPWTSSADRGRLRLGVTYERN